MGVGLFLARLIALGILGLALWDAWHFPVFAKAITFGLALYALVLALEVRAWLLVLPPAIALLSLGFWSGRYFWDAFDLFILVTLAGGLWSRVPWWPDKTAVRIFWPIALLALVQILVTLNGLYPLEAPVEGLWADYYASTNALREGKAVLWGLLLVPMLLQAQRMGNDAARWWVAGMAAGLLAVGLAVVWERYLYTGIFNFGAAYRVSGWFFDLHTGGAAIDVALAMMLPFVFGLWIWWTRWPAHLAMVGLLALGSYGLLVTFSRANYPAVGAAVLVLLIGLSTLPGLGRRAGPVLGLRVYLFAAGLLLLVPLLIGGTIKERFQTTLQDMQTRLDHWQTSLDLVNPGLEHWLGIGKGSFPRRYHLAKATDGEHLATLLHHRDGAQAFIRFSASDPGGSLDLRQRFRPTDQTVRLSITARTAPGTSERLLVEFCERHVLRVRSECDWVGTNIADTQGRWQEYSRPVRVGRLGQGAWLKRSPVDISILNRGIQRGLDIASVRLIDAKGRDLLANPDFSAGTDHWFFVDGNHLRWHVKNLFVYAYVEGGLLGLAALLVVVAVALWRSWRLHRAGDPMGVLFAASIAAGLSIGLFDSVLDAPRVAVLFLMPLLGAIVWQPQPVALAARFAGYPSWMPRPLALAGGIAGLLVLVVLARTVISNQLTLAQSVVHYGEKLGLSNRFLIGLVNTPTDAFDAGLALRPVAQEPRIWRDLPRSAGASDCRGSGLERLAVCWAVDRDAAAGSKALAALHALWDVKPRSYGEYGNGWLLALAYDLLSDHPEMTPTIRQQLQQRLQRVLGHYLLLLNSDGPAVWHGRAALAAQAMIIGAVLQIEDEHAAGLLRQVHFHYLQLLDSLSVAEAWPEGYNYWVNSRGFLAALAAYAYLQAFPDALAAGETRRVFSRIGLWHLHNTRPDLKAIQIGDEGPRIDLREETQRIIDTLYLVTGDPWLSAYSRLLGQRFGGGAYYRGYRWLRPLLQRDAEQAGSPTLNDWALPTADWFGREAMNLLYLRSGWEEDATVLSFRAGHTLSHHSHADAGHFTLFKGAPLAVTGATYRGVGSGHRLDYGVRTVSKNSLLIMRPGEVVRPAGYERENVADGGQRLAMPLRNPLSSLADWRGNLGQGMHLEGGEIRAFRHEPTAFTYIDADISRAYNTPEHDEGGKGGKVRSVVRQLVYLRRLDRVLLRDRVETTDPAYQVKWLLQSMAKPELEQAMRLKGDVDNGILATTQSEFRFSNGRGRLHLASLLPEQRETLVIGGKDYRFYTDVDGDPETLDGKNMGQDSRIASWFEPALWRLEIGRRGPAHVSDFLTLLSPSIDAFRPPEVALLEATPAGVVAARVDDEVIVFIEDPQLDEISLSVPSGVAWLRLFGLPPGAVVTVAGQRHSTTAEGTLSLRAVEQIMQLSWPAS